MPVMIPATKMTPNACQKCPFTRFQERLIAARPRRFSTISTGTDTERSTSEDDARDHKQDESTEDRETDQ